MGPYVFTCYLLVAAGGPGVMGDRVASKWRAGAGFAGTTESGGVSWSHHPPLPETFWPTLSTATASWRGWVTGCARGRS